MSHRHETHLPRAARSRPRCQVGRERGLLRRRCRPGERHPHLRPAWDKDRMSGEAKLLLGIYRDCGQNTCFTRAPARPASVLPSSVAKVAVACPLHDGPSAGELDLAAEPLREREVQAADQQETKLRLTQLLVELCIPASRDIDLVGISRLLPYAAVESAILG